MSRKAQHGLATIDNRVYNWGGNITGSIPYVHRSPLITSTVEVFDMESFISWNSVATTGVPPAAVTHYSSCSVGSKMYTFGGSCMPYDCYHNDLFAFDTLNKEWRQVDCIDSPTTSPMKKRGAGMIYYSPVTMKNTCLCLEELNQPQPLYHLLDNIFLTLLFLINHTLMRCTC